MNSVCPANGTIGDAKCTGTIAPLQLAPAEGDGGSGAGSGDVLFQGEQRRLPVRLLVKPGLFFSATLQVARFVLRDGRQCCT